MMSIPRKVIASPANIMLHRKAGVPANSAGTLPLVFELNKSCSSKLSFGESAKRCITGPFLCPRDPSIRVLCDRLRRAEYRHLDRRNRSRPDEQEKSRCIIKVIVAFVRCHLSPGCPIRIAFLYSLTGAIPQVEITSGTTLCRRSISPPWHDHRGRHARRRGLKRCSRHGRTASE